MQKRILLIVKHLQSFGKIDTCLIICQLKFISIDSGRYRKIGLRPALHSGAQRDCAYSPG
jgi:hypothetical protein